MTMSKHAIMRFAAALPLLAWTEAAIAQSTVQPVYLRCEEQVNPLGIGNTTPHLSWQLQSTGSGPGYRGETQSAYEVMVGTSPGGSELWDSGKVASAQT